MKDYMRGGTNSPVSQGPLKGSGGAGGGSGKADGMKYGDTNTSVSQGPAKGKMINTGQNDSKKEGGATEKGAILSTLDRKDSFKNPKSGKAC